MFISNMSHFLDPEGNIAKEMHKEGREHASFLALIIDTATKDYTPSKKSTEIRCMKKKCTGNIEIKVEFKRRDHQLAMPNMQRGWKNLWLARNKMG